MSISITGYMLSSMSPTISIGIATATALISLLMVFGGFFLNLKSVLSTYEFAMSNILFKNIFYVALFQIGSDGSNTCLGLHMATSY